MATLANAATGQVRSASRAGAQTGAEVSEVAACRSGRFWEWLRARRKEMLAGAGGNSGFRLSGCCVGGKTAVFGNEACDLDSIVSAVGQAFLLSRSSVELSESVPVIPIARADFRLRRDAVYLFKLAGFKLDGEEAPTELIFLDDLPAEPCFQTVWLTDHNSQTLVHPAIGDAPVVGITDHHSDSCDHTHVTKKKRNIVGGLGSASTLVAEKLLEESIANPEILPDCLRLLLLTTILLDTRNWDPAKGTDRDRVAFESLLGNSDYLRSVSHNLYAQVHGARMDVSMLSFSELLRLDYKSCSSLPTVTNHHRKCSAGIASIMCTLRRALELENNNFGRIVSRLESFAGNQSIDFALAFFKRSKDSGYKDLVISANTDEAREKLSSLLEFLASVHTAPPASLKRDASLLKQNVFTTGLISNIVEVGDGWAHVAIFPKISRKSLKPCVETWMSL